MISGPRNSATHNSGTLNHDLPPGHTTPASSETLPDSSSGDNPLALIPVRMLNEFTYCPRLGYLEWVQGEWADNLETLEGTFGHRNVDKPDRKIIAAPGDSDAVSENDDTPTTTDGDETARIHARSLMLSAPGEGLIARLDLLELEGDVATPVDYKRGRVPDIPGNAYDPERVQLCAQGLILRENGYECNEGVLYFIASRKRVVVPFDDELINLTRSQAQQFRETAHRGNCPPPLEDSPKCPRCSLVTICLPDETNFLKHIAPDSSGDHCTATTDTTPSTTEHRPDGLRRLLPASHDALPLYVQEFGAYVGKSGDRLVVSRKREELASVRLLDVSQLCLMGNITLSAPALKELTIRGIPVCHFTYGGWFHAITSGLSHNNVELRIRQYEVAADPQQALPLARSFIVGKVKNCRTLLRRHLKDRHARVLRQLRDYTRRIEQVDSIESLLGLEGMAAKEYFAAWFTLISGQHDFDVTGRNRRPPRDPVNAVLSFAYSLLTKEMTVTLQAVGFDPMRGFLHRPRFSRPSLALDLAEEFRPLIADSVALSVFNNKEVDSTAFLERAGAVTLTPAGRRSVLAAFERRLQSEITHPIFGYRISYRRILDVQARLLARTVLRELDAYPNFCTR